MSNTGNAKDAITFEKMVKTDNGTCLRVEIPGSYMENELSEKTMLTEAECRQAGIPIEKIYEEQIRAQVLANGMFYDLSSKEFVTPTPDSQQERLRAKSMGMQQVIEIVDIVPRPIVSECLQPYQEQKQKSSLRLAQPLLRQEKPIVSATLPPMPLGDPQIYKGEPYVRASMYTECEDAQGPQQKLDAAIFAGMVDAYQFRNYENVLYRYVAENGCYKPCSNNDLGKMINLVYGDEILRKGSHSTYKNVIDFLHCEAKFCISEVAIPEPDYWPFKNYIVNVRTGKCYPNNGDYFIRSCLQCDYDPAADCPQFQDFLWSASAQDDGVFTLLWEVIGYLLSSDTKCKNFFVFEGPKNCGKSLLANVITEIIGQDSVSHLSISDFSSNFGPACLLGKQLNACMDISSTPLRPEQVAKIKMLTGGDTMHADIKFGQPVSFKNTARLLFGTNFPISIVTPDSAFSERKIDIPFRQSVPKERQDPDLLEKFRSEYAGIVNCAISAYQKLVGNHRIFTEIGRDTETHENVNQTVLVQDVIKKCFIVTGNEADKVSSAEAYRYYTMFCERSGIAPSPLNDFSRNMTKLGIEKKKARFGNETLQAFIGLKINSSF